MYKRVYRRVKILFKYKRLKIVAKYRRREYNKISKLEKEIERLKSKPKDYTYEEAKALLNKLGFYENNKGRTSGSRVVFMNRNNIKIELHKPHPSNILKPYQVHNLLKKLSEMEEFK